MLLATPILRPSACPSCSSPLAGFGTWAANCAAEDRQGASPAARVADRVVGDMFVPAIRCEGVGFGMNSTAFTGLGWHDRRRSSRLRQTDRICPCPSLRRHRQPRAAAATPEPQRIVFARRFLSPARLVVRRGRGRQRRAAAAAPATWTTTRRGPLDGASTSSRPSATVRGSVIASSPMAAASSIH